MYNFEYTINFNTAINSSEGTINLSSGEIQEIHLLKNKIIVIFALELDASVIDFDTDKGLWNQKKINHKIGYRVDYIEKSLLDRLIVLFNLYNLENHIASSELRIFINNQWTSYNLALDSFVSDKTLSFSFANKSNLNKLADHILDKEKIPTSLLMLQHSKTIKDNKIRFISLAIAAEIGIKDYLSNYKNVGTILESMPSPPIDKLLSDSIFSKITGKNFSKDLRKKLKKGAEIRNRLVHSNAVETTITLQEVLNYQETVQTFLGYLYSDSLLPEQKKYSPFFENLCDFISLDEMTGANTKQLNLTKNQQKEIAENIKFFSQTFINKYKF